MELVNDLPLEQEPEYVDLVTIYKGNSNSAAVTSARLTSLGIESWIKDEGIQCVFPNLGPAEVQVCMQDKELTLQALGTTTTGAESLDEETV
ncbi:MAG: hypothetical protein HZB26_05285 [Candidatus Hydrogenedentes bacterium]|nr:hypothetical protein [Candidatus Hydrogenedentota bacterium]